MSIKHKLIVLLEQSEPMSLSHMYSKFCMEISSFQFRDDLNDLIEGGKVIVVNDRGHDYHDNLEVGTKYFTIPEKPRG